CSGSFGSTVSGVSISNSRTSIWLVVDNAGPARSAESSRVSPSTIRATVAGCARSGTPPGASPPVSCSAVCSAAGSAWPVLLCRGALDVVVAESVLIGAALVVVAGCWSPPEAASVPHPATSTTHADTATPTDQLRCGLHSTTRGSNPALTACPPCPQRHRRHQYHPTPEA